MKFICCSDLHLRSDTPRCRKQTQEEWIETQRQQLFFIADKAKEYDCPIIICGDIFHVFQVPDYIKNMFIDAFKTITVYAIGGQHDFPWNKFDNINNSSFGVLLNSDIIKQPIGIGKFAHYGEEIQCDGDMLFLHTLVFPDEKSMPPNTKAMTAQEALDKYPDINFIFAGDQHKSFLYDSNKSDGRFVLVPGCLNAQSSDQDYDHFIWYINTENTDNIEQIQVPDDCEIVTDTYVQESKEKLDRVKSFAVFVKEKMQQGKGSGIDFKLNVGKGMENNPDLTEGSKRIINMFMNEEEQFTVKDLYTEMFRRQGYDEEAIGLALEMDPEKIERQLVEK